MAQVFATRTLALAYLDRGQLTEAETQFRKLITLVPDDPVAYADLGLTFLEGGRYREAADVLDKARKLDPANADVGLLLAQMYTLTGRSADARTVLEKLARDTTASARVLYALAALDASASDSATQDRRAARLLQVLRALPANIAVRLELTRSYVTRGKADAAVQQLEEVRRIPPALPDAARQVLDSTITLLQLQRVADAERLLERLTRVVETTGPYQAARNAVKGADAPLVGQPALSFAPAKLIARGVRTAATVDSVRFEDVTDVVGLTNERPQGNAAALATAALGDVDGNGSDELFLSRRTPSGRASTQLFSVQGGFLGDITQRAALALTGAATFATFADFDNDGWLDLFMIGADGQGQLWRNQGNGAFTNVTAKAGLAQTNGARSAVVADLDHDGDLDLLLYGGRTITAYRNNLDGTFTASTDAFGLASVADARSVAFADLDDDGRVDLVVGTAANGVRVFANGGPERFRDVTATSGLTSSGTTVAVGDYNNDGSFDLLVTGPGSELAFWRNDGTGHFTLDRRALGSADSPRLAAPHAAEFVDYDNDGALDLVVAGTPRAAGASGLLLFRNLGNGTFVDRSAILPSTVRALDVARVVVSDLDDDGDQDLLLTGTDGSVRQLRNNGGNSNMAVRVALKGLRTGSGKNNDFGIGARLDLRAGEIYQARVVTGRVTHFGLGPHLKADVLRVQWPNGVPQMVYLPGADQDVVENELLKGSCALAYAWDGTGFRFVTDVMWRSALGMPLGLMAGGKTGFAPAGASQEYVRIPGQALQSRNGRHVLQLTEELWETAYMDEVRLLAVDHPDSVSIFVDERFVPPGPVNLKLYHATQRQDLVSATDDRGNDVREALRASDDRYVSNLTPVQYQGVVEPHELILDLGDRAGSPGSYLFLRGWIYPTDASINVALAQQTATRVTMPALEVRDAKGRWVTAADIGFPSGKDKTIVVDLAGKFPTPDHHVRIRTNMQIYWDEAFLSYDATASAAQVTTLPVLTADLHFRGFSRMYRKGGRYGPYWFAYDDVTTQSPWRRIEGTFTRFGDVLQLLNRGDDQYVTMGPGDEVTMEFDAASERALPKGWKRDFLLYSDGWIKDSDLNTATGTAVEPLPFHAMTRYPYEPGDVGAAAAPLKQMRERYNTRQLPR
ncbi:MAG: FG-GAP-like repeat-containing protein [Gemmatimonadaceae bacterium]